MSNIISSVQLPQLPQLPCLPLSLLGLYQPLPVMSGFSSGFSFGGAQAQGQPFPGPIQPFNYAPGLQPPGTPSPNPARPTNTYQLTASRNDIVMPQYTPAPVPLNPPGLNGAHPHPTPPQVSLNDHLSGGQDAGADSEMLHLPTPGLPVDEGSSIHHGLAYFADAIANSYGFGEKEAHLRENLHGFLKVRLAVFSFFCH